MQYDTHTMADYLRERKLRVEKIDVTDARDVFPAYIYQIVPDEDAIAATADTLSPSERERIHADLGKAVGGGK